MEQQSSIVFFSRDGSTRLAAEVLSERIDAALLELREAKTKRNFLVAGMRAKTKHHARLLGDPWSEVANSNLVVLAAPIWAGSGNPAMNGFLDRADLSGKSVYILTVQADPNLGSSEAVLEHYRRRVQEVGGTVGGTRAIAGARPGRTADEASVRDALDGWVIR